ncbi:MAG: thermonuclease family protein [Pyrinomonadaceae bacterium]
MTIILQLIEVPEPGQQLNKEIADHLGRLLLGKTVEFKVSSMTDNKTVGMVFLNQIDVSQQMLRDGAAWLLPPEVTGYDMPGRELYAASEAQAKTEKLGVWSIKDLKPAWEYRAEKAEQNRQSSARDDSYRFSSVGDPTPGRPRGPRAISNSDPDLTVWVDVMSDRGKEAVGVKTRYDSDAGFGVAATSPTILYLTSGKERLKLEIRALSVSHNRSDTGKDKIYVIGLQIASRELKSVRTNNMSIDSDGQVFSLVPAKHSLRQTSYGPQELLFYVVSQKTLTAIASARRSRVTIGAFAGSMDVDSQALMLQLLDTSR